MRVELLRISVIMGDLVPHGSLLVEPTLVGGYINPTVVPWQRGLLLMTGLAWLAADGVNPSETVQFRILSPRAMSEAHVVNRPTEDLPYPVRVAGTYSDAGKAVTGIGQLLQPLDQPFLGQDPRALALSPDRLLVVFTNRFTATLSMGLAVLTVNGTARPDYLQGTYPAGDGPGAAVPYNHMLKDLPYLAEASKTPPYRGHQAADGRNLVLSHLYPSVGAAEALHQHHKNWAPFLYRRAGDNASLAYHIYLVKYINPLTVVQPDWESVDPHSGHVGVRLVSQAPKANLSFWGYGELRGGTPARRMPDGRFLAFFHSSGKIGRWFTS